MANMNALGNINNPFQTSEKRVLCVCSAGLLRSPTTANVLHQVYGYNTRAAGCMAEYALIPVTDLLLHWADEIVVMEDWHGTKVTRLLQEEGLDKPVIVLNVPDNYPWNNQKLRDFISTAYKEKTT